MNNVSGYIKQKNDEFNGLPQDIQLRVVVKSCAWGSVITLFSRIARIKPTYQFCVFVATILYVGAKTTERLSNEGVFGNGLKLLKESSQTGLKSVSRICENVCNGAEEVGSELLGTNTKQAQERRQLNLVIRQLTRLVEDLWTEFTRTMTL